MTRPVTEQNSELLFQQRELRWHRNPRKNTTQKIAVQENILSSARRQCKAYTRLYIHWRRITVLLLMLDVCRLTTTSTWQLSTVDNFFSLFYTVDDFLYCRRLTLHIHNTAYIHTLPLAWNNMEPTRNWNNATCTFDCPLESSNYKCRTQLDYSRSFTCHV